MLKFMTEVDAEECVPHILRKTTDLDLGRWPLRLGVGTGCIRGGMASPGGWAARPWMRLLVGLIGVAIGS